MISRNFNKYDLIVSGILNDEDIQLDYPRVKNKTVPYSIILAYKVIILCVNGIMTYRIYAYTNGSIIYKYLKGRYISVKGGYSITKEDYNNFIKAINKYYETTNNRSTSEV